MLSELEKEGLETQTGRGRSIKYMIINLSCKLSEKNIFIAKKEDMFMIKDKMDISEIKIQQVKRTLLVQLMEEYYENK